jgi:hypothetical protein
MDNADKFNYFFLFLPKIKLIVVCLILNVRK